MDDRTVEEERRSEALKRATEWAQSFRQAAPAATSVVEAAKIFESYLKGSN